MAHLLAVATSGPPAANCRTLITTPHDRIANLASKEIGVNFEGSNDARMHRGASDVELEWQRCLHLGWACRQYFSDEIGEPQRHRETVRESRAVEVQFRQRHDVTEHDFKVCIPLTLSTVIGLGTLGSNSYRKAPRCRPRSRWFPCPTPASGEASLLSHVGAL